MGHDELTHSNLESQNSARISVQKARPIGSWRPFSTRSRMRWSGSEASKEETESWATEGMKGHILLVRNSTMLAANVIAQRNLEARIHDLTRERYECLRANDRGRELFLRRLRMKGGRFCEMVSDVEAKRKSRSRTSGLYAISELNRTRRGASGDPLMMHSRPILTTGEDDKTQGDSTEEEEEEEDKEMLNEDEDVSSIRANIRNFGSQSAHLRYGPNSRHHLDDKFFMRSFSAIPVTRGRYKDNIPTNGPSIRKNGIFAPPSTTPQPPSKLQPDEFGFDRPKSCVFSDVCQRSLMSEIPECVQVTKLIDDIDSLHVAPRTAKKVKPKSDAVLRDIFRL